MQATTVTSAKSKLAEIKQPIREDREPVRIEFAPLTLLFGPNNAGKSTIIKALQLAPWRLSASAQDPFSASSRSGVDIGDFREAVNNHDIENTLVFRFELELSGQAQVDYQRNDGFKTAFESNTSVPWSALGSNIKRAALEIQVDFDVDTSSAYLSRYDVTLNDIRFGTIEFSPSQKDSIASITFLNYAHPPIA
jgi:hypothetical protein